MKKRILFFSLALCLLLSACASPAVPGTTTADPGTTGTETSGTSSSTTSPPSNVKLNTMGTMEPMPGFDAQNKYAYMAISGFQETDTFFFGNNDHTLYYYDKVTGISDVLCADPACMHSDKTCGAWTAMGASVFWYNGQRWWVAAKEDGSEDDRDYYLYRSDLSGLNQEKIKRIDFTDITLVYQPQQYAIHRGNLFALGKNDTLDGAQTKRYCTLLASPLDGTGEFAVLFESKSDGSANNYVRFAGTKVYYTLKTTAEIGGPSDFTITTYDLATGEYETVLEELQTTEYLTEPWVTEAGEIYLSSWDGETAYLWKVADGKRVLAASWAEDQYPPEVLDGIATNFRMIDGDWHLVIHDYTGNLLYEGKMLPAGLPGANEDPTVTTFSVVGGDQETLVLIVEEQPKGQRIEYTVMLDVQNGMKTTVLWSVTTERRGS